MAVCEEVRLNNVGLCNYLNRGVCSVCLSGGVSLGRAYGSWFVLIVEFNFFPGTF